MPDFVGAFAVTAGHGLDELVTGFEEANDDYSAILAKALADRLAEAFAERLHERVRRELWGYAPDEALANPDLIAERYQGIRPAPGYPACPDHTEKGTLFDLLEAEPRAGIRLTESFAMWPGASVSGYYFWNPASAYFGIGRIGRDQLADYAARKGVPVAEAEMARPNLADDDEAAAAAAAVPGDGRGTGDGRRLTPRGPRNAKRGARPRGTSPATVSGTRKEGRACEARWDRRCRCFGGGARGPGSRTSRSPAESVRQGPVPVQYFGVIANRTGPQRSGPDRIGPGHRSGADRHRWVGYPRPMTTTTDPALADLLERRPSHRPGRHRDPAPDHRRPEIGMDLPVTRT